MPTSAKPWSWRFTASGVDHLFFTSGAEIVWYQEAIAKAHAQGRPAPRLITMTHEHASLNAALGYAAGAASGRHRRCTWTREPIITAARFIPRRTPNLPVMIMAGGPPVSYTGTMKGSRDRGGHLWMQQSFDQNGIVRNYVKWEHRLEYQDNPRLMASRGLQIAQSDPRGPVYMKRAARNRALAGARNLVPLGLAARHSAPGCR